MITTRSDPRRRPLEPRHDWRCWLTAKLAELEALARTEDLDARRERLVDRAQQLDLGLDEAAA